MILFKMSDKCSANVKGRILWGCICILCISLVVLFIVLSNTTQVKRPLDSIEALLNSKTYIKNDHELLDKLNKIMQEGNKHLQIVTDFDQTLTADPGENGKIVINSYDMLRRCPSIPQSYKDEDTELYYKYKPIEQNANLSIEEKSKYLIEWYRKSKNLLRGLKFPRKELENIAKNVSNSFRERVSILIQWSEANRVPVLVLSSGLGDAVVASLKAANLLTPNVKVISNFLEIDKDDIITGVKGDPIHSYNKNEASIQNTDYYNIVKERTNVILLGDSIGDAHMTDGMDHCDAIIKVGFLSKKKRNELKNYLNYFDIVLENDQTMDVVNAILKLL